MYFKFQLRLEVNLKVVSRSFCLLMYLEQSKIPQLFVVHASTHTVELHIIPLKKTYQYNGKSQVEDQVDLHVRIGGGIGVSLV